MVWTVLTVVQQLEFAALVQCLLGHKSPIMTQRYAHHYPESLRAGVEMLERYRPASTSSTNLAHLAQAAGPALATTGVSC